MSREVERAPVSRSQDPLQLNLTSPESWAVPRLVDPAAAKDSLKDLGGRTRNTKQGAWEGVAQRTSDFLQEHSQPRLNSAAWHVLAQTKLRNYTAAYEALSFLGDLDNEEYIEETSTGKDSRVPFILRILLCELQIKLNNVREGLDAYYSLLDFCRSKMEASDAPSHHLALWQRREERVVAALFVHHLRLKDYMVALHWLSWMMDCFPDNPHLLSTAGCVQLSIGHIQPAASLFQESAKLMSSRPHASSKDRQAVQRNNALLLFAQNDMSGAAAEFRAIAADNPKDAAAANNRAICEMYAGGLTDAVQSLEAYLQSEPLAMLHEPIFRNLAGMYALHAPLSGEGSKRSLGNWALHIAPDDFDLSFL